MAFNKIICCFFSFSARVRKQFFAETTNFVNIAINEKNMHLTLVWWHKPVIPALRRQRQKNYEFKASLSYNKTLSQKGGGEGNTHLSMGFPHDRPWTRCFLNISLHVDQLYSICTFFLSCGNLINMLGDNLKFPLKINQIERNTGKIHWIHWHSKSFWEQERGDCGTYL